jgi:hypothetical protein
MAELLPRARQTAPVIPRDISDDRWRGQRVGVGVEWQLGSRLNEGPGVLIWRSNPGPPAVTVAWRRAVQHSLYACSPRCCPAPGGRARGRCGRRFGSLIAGVAADGCACAARVTEARSTAGRTALRSVARRIYEWPAPVTKRLGVARTYTRIGNGGTGPGARRDGARKKW